MNAPVERLANAFALSPDPAQAFLEACALDVQAFKPGNVSQESPGHGMEAAHFLSSAEAAAPHLADFSLGVGERIYRAIEATRRAVACNTNLGIVLLAAPLLHAAQHRQAGESLARRLQRTLARLTVEDADWVYRAIRLAAPAGLGSSPRHDVHTAPAVTLLAAMHEAAHRDRIARQYAGCYGDVFATGLPALRMGRKCWGDDARAGVMVYLSFLSQFPDSHVARKYGNATADQVMHMARGHTASISDCPDWAGVRALLETMDGALKSAEINPGTSADLTVTTWLMDRLQGPEPESGPGQDLAMESDMNSDTNATRTQEGPGRA